MLQWWLQEGMREQPYHAIGAVAGSVGNDGGVLAGCVSGPTCADKADAFHKSVTKQG